MNLYLLLESFVIKIIVLCHFSVRLGLRKYVNKNIMIIRGIMLMRDIHS